MSKTIDERVVEMRFDNQHFEKNVSTTMSTLDKLKQKLNLNGASKGLEDINAAAGRVNMSGLGGAVETVSAKFSALQVVGITALANITNSAINAGKNIVSALTIQPVTTGFNEYELKMNSVQTIMASTGESLATVNQYLAELNEYSDKTIYSFSDMTQNIGKFTNAGVELKDAVAAIKGISNEAAMSGANANEASRAMYNFAQALSAGYVKLIDWKSIENANMATVKFKEELIKTAVEMGTLTKVTDGYKTAEGKVITATKNFNDSLQDQWMTSDVLIKTLGKYADETTDIGHKASQAATEVKTLTQLFDTLKESAQSGWAQTWEYIVGDFEEAKDFMTKLSKSIGGVVDGMSKWRNNLVGGAVTSNWEKLTSVIEKAGLSVEDFQEHIKKIGKDKGLPIDTLIEDYESLKKAIEAGEIPANILTEALQKLLGTEEKLSKTTEEYGKIVDRVLNGEFGDGEERVKALTEAGYDYAKVQNIINERLGSSVRHTEKLTETQLDNADALVKLSDAQLKEKGYTKEQIEALRELQKAADEGGTSINDMISDMERVSGRTLIIQSFENIGKAIGKVFETIGKAWGNVFDKLTGDDLYSIIERIEGITEAMVMNEEAAERFERILTGVFSAIDISWSVASASLMGGMKILSAILDLFGVDLLEGMAWVADRITDLNKYIEGVAFFGSDSKWTDIAAALKAFAEGVYDCVKAFLNLDKVQGIVKNFTGALSGFFGSFDGTVKLLSIENVVDKITTAFDKLEKWITGLNDSENLGLDLIKGIGNGILKGVEYVVQAIKNAGIFLISSVFSVFGIDAGPILSGWTKLIDFISDVAGHIKDFVIEFAKLKPVQDIVKTFGSNVAKAFETLTKSFGGLDNARATMEKFFSDLKEWMKGLENSEDFGHDFVVGLCNGINKGITWVIKAITNIATTLIDSFCALLGIHSPSRVMMTIGGFIIAGLLLGLTQKIPELDSLIDNMGNLFVTGFEKLGEVVKKIAEKVDLGKIIAVALSTGIILAIKDLTNVLELFGAPLQGLENMFSGIGTMFKDIGQGIEANLKGKAWDKKATALLKMAAAIGILALSIKLLSTMDPWAVVGCIAAIGVLAGIMFALAVACEKLNKVGEFGLASTSLLSIGASLLMVAWAFKILTEIDYTQAGNAIGAFITIIGGLLLALLGMAVLSNYADSGSLGAVSKAVRKLAITLLLIVGVVAVASLIDDEALQQAVKTLSIAALLIAEFLILSKFPIDGAEGIGKMIWKMSLSLLILVGLIQIASMITPGELGWGVLVLTAASAFVGAFMYLTKYIKQTKDVDKVGKMILEISVALLLMVQAIKIAGSLDLAAAIQGTIVIGVMVGLCAALVAVSKFSGANAVKAGLMLIEVSVALLIMSAVLLLLKELDPEGLDRAMDIIFNLTKLFGGLIMITMFAKHADKVKGTLITLTVAIGVLAIALAALSFIEPTSLKTAAACLTGVIGVFALLVYAMSCLKPLEKGQKGHIATLITLTAIVAVLGGVIYVLSKCNPQGAIGAGIGLGALLVSLATSLKILSTAKVFEKGTLTKMLGAIAMLLVLTYALIPVIHLLQGIDPVSSIAGAVSLGALLLALATSLDVISKSKSMGNKTKLAGIMVVLIELTVIVAALGLVLWGLRDLNPINAIGNAMALGVLLTALANSFSIIANSKSLTKAQMKNMAGILVELAGITVILGVALLMLQNVNPINSIGSAIGLGILLIALSASFDILSTSQSLTKAKMQNMAIVLAELAGIVVILSVALLILKNVNPLASVGNAIALGVLLGVLSISMGIISSIPVINPVAIGSLALMGLVVAELGVILWLLQEMELEASLGTVAALSVLILAMSAALVIVSAVGAFAVTAIPGVAALAIFIAATAALVAAIGLIFQNCPELSDLINSGIPLLVQLANGIGQIIGAFAGGIIEGVASSLPTLGTCLSDFMTNAQPFITGVQQIDAVALLAGIGAITAAVIALTAADLVEGIASFLQGGESFASLGTELSQFMINATPFFTGLALVNPDSLMGVKALAEAVLTLTANNILEGLTSWFAGEHSLADFGKEIAEFGPYLAQFAQSVAGVDVASIKTAADGALTLVKMAKEIPNTGGLVASVTGDNDLGTFGPKIAAFGEHLATYAKHVAGLDVEAIKTSASGAKALIKLAKDIPNTGGLVAAVTGDNDLATFGTKIKSFGASLKTYADNISGMDVESVKNSAGAAKALIGISKSIPNSGGLKTLVTGDNDLATFGSKIAAFGKHLANYGENINGVDTAKLSSSSTSLKELIKIAKAADGVDFGGLKSFGKALKKLGDAGVDEFIDAFNNADTEAKTAAKKMANGAVKGAESALTAMEKAGKKLGTSIVDGMKLKETALEKAAKNVAKSGADAASKKKSSFKSAGKDLGDGLVEGINAKQNAAWEAGYALGQKAVEGEKAGQQSNSPSKLTILAGKWLGEGLIVGMEKMTSLVYRSGYGLGESATNSISSTISRIGDMVNADIDAQPTIRPVLDLSDVSTGVGTLNRMLDMNSSIGLMSNINSISSMTGRNQNGSANDVVLAIEKLNKSLSNLPSGDTYSINGVTYDDGSNIAGAIQTIARAAIRERRV